MKKIPIIIDCDPGADDSLGILLALHSPQLKVLGITTVCGNAPAMQTALNATKVLALAGCEQVLVHCGADQPLKRSLEFSTKYSGADGLCETGLVEKKELLSEVSAKDYLIAALKQAEEPVTLISLAGFTNIAQALQEEPFIAGGIREIVAASGYFGLNQKECRAEWNILVDPEAAEIVYGAGIPVRAVGLDVTCMLENAHMEQVLSWGTGSIHKFLQGCDAYNRKVGLSPYSLLVDGMAVAAAIRPEIAEYAEGSVTVHPERTDAGLMDFVKEADFKERVPGRDSGYSIRQERKLTESVVLARGGLVKAAFRYDINAYLDLIKGMVTA